MTKGDNSRYDQAEIVEGGHDLQGGGHDQVEITGGTRYDTLLKEVKVAVFREAFMQQPVPPQCSNSWGRGRKKG